MDNDRRNFMKNTVVAGMTVAVSGTLINSEALGKGASGLTKKETKMNALKFFMDTHDRANETFPAKISPAEFEVFYAKYEKACYEEGVIPLRLHVGYDEGRAFCFTMAPNAESVKRAHDRVGLPYDTITEITTATPGDTFFRRPA